MKSYIKDYPRPQLVRKDWKNLNGNWDFQFDDSNCGEKNEWYLNFPQNHINIQVPFTYETKLSGIEDPAYHKNIWYNRVFEVKETELQKKRLLIHFEGCDFLTKVWVNGKFIGIHKGGYARFSFDITRYVKAGENIITVKAEDSLSPEQPRGKQRWLKYNYECWYVQTTGIWKTVWLESVPEIYLSGLKMTPDVINTSLELTYHVTADELPENLQIEAEVEFEGTLIQRSSKGINRNTVQDRIDLFQPEETHWGIHYWSPKRPSLYDICIRIKQGDCVIDEIRSYFGMREIRTEDGNVLLNGTPIYQRLILDQGYWKDSHMTPPDEAALIDDIDKLLALGYNGVRKHMKIEDERFLYWCDVKGVLVWSEMAATYEFSDEAVKEFTNEWVEIVHQNYNHPSIITWTPFNESWGIHNIMRVQKQQAFTEAIYYLTKSIDGMRPVILNDGWEHTLSDIITWHDYEETGEAFLNRYADHLDELMNGQIYPNTFRGAFAEGFAYKGQPIILSEYGGIAFSGGKEGDWGYGDTVSTEEEFLNRMDKITTAIKKIPYFSGYCYTQISDVQQEINGLLDEKHEYKIAPKKIKEINCRQEGLRKIVMN